MGHSKAWLCVLLALNTTCSEPLPVRLRVVQVGQCYSDEDYEGKLIGLGRICFFAVQHWQDTPSQRQQLDSLAANLIVSIAKDSAYGNCGVVYHQYNEKVNENTKHLDGTDSSLLTQGTRIANYSWERRGYYDRGLYNERGFPLSTKAQGKPLVVVNAELEIVPGPVGL